MPPSESESISIEWMRLRRQLQDHISRLKVLLDVGGVEDQTTSSEIREIHTYIKSQWVERLKRAGLDARGWHMTTEESQMVQYLMGWEGTGHDDGNNGLPSDAKVSLNVHNTSTPSIPKPPTDERVDPSTLTEIPVRSSTFSTLSTLADFWSSPEYNRLKLCREMGKGACKCNEGLTVIQCLDKH